ncbi:MAG: class I SAM-dependent methyltransferase [Ignavibacteriales bacterium]|jgi:ubiquinone/menaquinone biosynthesis C-methylase UbiE|nr:MAG: class I SAM-dependent methyltransferase [Ignavibacteriales bacterium]
MTANQEQIFFEIHTDTPREGPGNFESTKAVYSLLTELPEKPTILDVGCGPGKQTLDLAKISNGKIIAFDNHKPYINKLNEMAAEFNLSSRISGQVGDMNDLQFAENSFDVIWAEGSVYQMGIGKALELWKKFLKPNGYIVFSELCWLRNDRPEEIENYWNSFYGEIKTIDSVIKFLSNTDYKFIGSFVLPDNAWWDDYYTPLTNRINELKKKYANDPKAMQVLENESLEMEMHKKYSAYYGYSFFVVRKVN